MFKQSILPCGLATRLGCLFKVKKFTHNENPLQECLRTIAKLIMDFSYNIIKILLCAVIASIIQSVFPR